MDHDISLCLIFTIANCNISDAIILTGFQCSIAYQDILPIISSDNISDDDRSLFDDNIKNGNNDRSHSVIGFYQNRIARILPLYILCNLLILPLEYLGYLSLDPSGGTVPFIVTYITTFTFTSTMFIFLLGSPFDGVTWTVQTFVWLWIAFPLTMRYVRRIKNDDLVMYIKVLYYIQMLLVFILFFGTVSSLGFWPSFSLATMNPVTRYPLFLMGVVAGELVNRCNKQEVMIAKFWLHGILIPYMCSCDGLHEVKYSHILHLSFEDKTQLASQDLDYWRKRSNFKASLAVILTLVVAIVNSCSPSNIMGFIWLQAIVPYCHLDIIVSLTLDKGESLTAKILRNRVFQFLGKLGMTIYCMHYPMIYYLCFILNKGNKVIWPPVTDYNQCTDDDCYKNVSWYNYQRSIPMWGIPVVCLTTILLSIPIYFLFEEPMRKFLQTKK